MDSEKASARTEHDDAETAIVRPHDMAHAGTEVVSHHLLIAGTGRAGTSFLVRYLTALGLDTTLSRGGDGAFWDDRANAGLEDLLLPDPSQLPYVVKSPWTFAFIDEVIHCGKIHLDAAILPMRDMVEAAASRSTVEMQAMHRSLPWMTQMENSWEEFAHTPGGVVYSLNPLDQARILAVGFHKLLEQLVKADVPVVLLSFPRFVEDADYLFEKLAPVLGVRVSREASQQAHAAVAEPGMVRVGRELQPGSEDAPDGLTIRGPSPAQLDRTALARELAEVRKQCAALTEARLLGDQEKDDLTRRLDHAVAAMTDAETRNAGLERRIDETSRTIEALRVEAAQRAGQIDDLCRETGTLRAEAEILRTSLAILGADRAALAERLGGVEASTSWRVATTVQRMAIRTPRLHRTVRKLLGRN